MSTKPSLILISGHPATGKTTFARQLAAAIKVPSFSKDDFKECFFDVFERHNRDFSRQLGRAAQACLLLTAKRSLAAGQTVILESNFNPEFARAELLSLNVPIFEVNVVCNIELILQRFQNRLKSMDRHVLHGGKDDGLDSELRTRIESDSKACLFADALNVPIFLNGVLVESHCYDTTSPNDAKNAFLLGRISQWLQT